MDLGGICQGNFLVRLVIFNVVDIIFLQMVDYRIGGNFVVV